MLYRNKEFLTLDGLISDDEVTVSNEITRPTSKRKSFNTSPIVGVNAIFKRVFDVLFSIVAIFLLSPVLVIISVLIKFTSSGAVIFKQRRHGLLGEEIDVWKFRTMVCMENGSVVTQATKNDARITRLGKLLRRTSLDELPQFFNVLQGTMSVVGPRPHAVAHNEYYRGKVKNYMCSHVVKPGITGWAQINGARGETETIDKMELRVKLDLDYIKNWTLGLDVYIVFLTLFRGFSDHHVY